MDEIATLVESAMSDLIVLPCIKCKGRGYVGPITMGMVTCPNCLGSREHVCTITTEEEQPVRHLTTRQVDRLMPRLMKEFRDWSKKCYGVDTRKEPREDELYDAIRIHVEELMLDDR